MGMAAGYKRLGNCRDVIFRRPGHACFACGDSGVIQNGDGLVNRLVFADYDLLAADQHRSGSDLPLICCCSAARSGTAPDGNRRGGLLDASGALLNPRLGVLLQEPDRLLLHNTRLAAWRQTERDMHFTRTLRAQGESGAAPGYITATRQHCQNLARAQASNQPAVTGFHSIGAALASSVGGLAQAVLAEPLPKDELPADELLEPAPPLLSAAAGNAAAS
jgi:hypothetical protein